MVVTEVPLYALVMQSCTGGFLGIYNFFVFATVEKLRGNALTVVEYADN